MKKLVLLFYAITLFLLLTACGEKEKATPPVSHSVSVGNSVLESEPEKQTELEPIETVTEAIKPKYTHAVYELSIIETLINNDSVGQEWFNVYIINDEYISSGKLWTVPLDKTETVTIDVLITEDDNHPDTALDSSSVVLRDGFETSKIISVTENYGRHKGKSAQWKVTYKIKLIDRLVK